MYKELETYISQDKIIIIPVLNTQDRYNFMKICDIILDSPTSTTPLNCLLAIKAKKPFMEQQHLKKEKT